MGNYSGTLVQIDGKANVQNGGFEIQLVGNAVLEQLNWLMLQKLVN